MKLVVLGPFPLEDGFCGGAENHTRNLVNSLQKFADLEIHVITVSNQKEPSHHIKSGRINIHVINKRTLPMTFAGISLYPLEMLIKTWKIGPDLVHGQMVGAPYGFATALLSKKYPAVLTIHTLMEQNNLLKTNISGKIHDVIWSHLERWEIRTIPAQITVSLHLKSRLLELGAKSVSFIPNGIDMQKFQSNHKTITNRILFVGRITPIKGIEVVLEALVFVINEGYNIQLRVVGPYEKKEYYESLVNLCSHLKITEYVKFTGALFNEELIKEYSESSIFVLPSLDESNPIVLLEAMAAGKPIVATKVGGVVHLVEDGVNGFLVESKNPWEMAKALIKLLQDQELYRSMSLKCKEKAERYQWDNVASETHDFYLRLNMSSND